METDSRRKLSYSLYSRKQPLLSEKHPCQSKSNSLFILLSRSISPPYFDSIVRSHLCTVIVLVFVKSRYYLYGIVLTTWLCMCLCLSAQFVMLASILPSFLFYMYISLQINIKNLTCVHHCQRPWKFRFSRHYNRIGYLNPLFPSVNQKECGQFCKTPCVPLINL